MSPRAGIVWAVQADAVDRPTPVGVEAPVALDARAAIVASIKPPSPPGTMTPTGHDLALCHLHASAPAARVAAAIETIVGGSSAFIGPDEAATIVELRSLLAASVTGDVWALSAELGEVVVAASASMPDHVLVAAEIPSPSGLVMFAEPMVGLDAADGAELVTSAVSWLVVTDPDGPDRLVTYWWLATEATSPIGWVLLGGCQWVVGTSSSDPAPLVAGFSPSQLASVVEDRRRIATIWALAASERVVEVRDAPVARAARKRAQRAGLAATVRLVDVRRPAATSAAGADQAREWSHRWLVRGHWRQARVGPGRSARRPVWVAPHVKGPADKPLVVKDTINVIR